MLVWFKKFKQMYKIIPLHAQAFYFRVEIEAFRAGKKEGLEMVFALLLKSRFFLNSQMKCKVQKLFGEKNGVL